MNERSTIILSPVEILSQVELLSPGEFIIYYVGAFAYDIMNAKYNKKQKLWKLREAVQILEEAKLVELPSVKVAYMTTEYHIRRRNIAVPSGVLFKIEKLEDYIVPVSVR